MSTLSQPRIRIPRTAKPGEVIEIRTLIEHRQETGIRHDGATASERDMLTQFIVRRDGETIFSAELLNGTAANPYHVFFVRMQRTADFTFTWLDTKGRTIAATARVEVIQTNNRSESQPSAG